MFRLSQVIITNLLSVIGKTTNVGVFETQCINAIYGFGLCALCSDNRGFTLLNIGYVSPREVLVSLAAVDSYRFSIFIYFVNAYSIYASYHCMI